MTDSKTPGENIKEIRARMTAAARAAGRQPADITLIAVSKTHGVEVVRAAARAGQRAFGENRVQEAAKKFPALRAEFPDLKLHLIGPLQTNKAEEAVRLFDVIETLDRMKLAEALQRAMQKTGRRPRCYIEVNSGDEAQKAGISPAAAPAFIRTCRDELKLPVTGLMCIPPLAADPVPYFLKLAALADEHGLAHVSMGMSNDFERAISCGATEVRIGTALFGKR